MNLFSLFSLFLVASSLFANRIPKMKINQNTFVAIAFAMLIFSLLGLMSDVIGFQSLPKFTISIYSISFSDAKMGKIFLVLTQAVMLLVAVDVKTTIRKNLPSYINLALLTNLMLIFCFSASDILTFYVFFEFSIVPMFLIILLWGGKDKVLAAKQFFIYTIAGSLLILIPLIFLYSTIGTLDPGLVLLSEKFRLISPEVKLTLCAMMLLGFFVKIPVVPFHTWLPLAHVQAPTGGSVLLAGVLIKLGGYGIIRYVMPIFPDAINQMSSFGIIMGLISLFYGSFAAMGQTDIKKVIAYSSIAHMSYVVCGIFSMNQDGLNAAVFQMVSHGVVSAGLFYIIGILYSRTHTREISSYGNLYEKCPFYAKSLLILSMASVGLPGTIGFPGELLAVTSLANISLWYVMLLASGTLLGCVYMLNLCRRMMYVKTSGFDQCCLDNFALTSYEKYSLYAVIAAVLLFGIYPKAIFSVIG